MLARILREETRGRGGGSERGGGGGTQRSHPTSCSAFATGLIRLSHAGLVIRMKSQAFSPVFSPLGESSL